MEDDETRPDTADTALADTSAQEPTAGESPEDHLLGRSLAGRYRVESRIGRGGMGLVYEARHETLDKRVAVKVMRREFAANESSLARFEREAKAAAGLSGEHIIDVSDYGLTEEGEAFMVMELLEGQTLEQLLLREGPLEAGRAVAIVRQIAKGLAAAHEGGVIHRDLKTANVFLIDRDGRDHVKLLDFGISKLAEPEAEEVRLTSTGAVMGTPNYMSPEQARGQTDPDHRVDIYSLGVILFETLTGDVPFKGTNFLEIAYRVVNTEAPAPSEVRPDASIPAELDAIVAKCLSKDPDDRYQTALEAMEALPEPSTLPGGWSSGSLTGNSTAPPGITASPSAEDEPRRSLFPVVAVVAALLAGVVVTYLALGPAGDDNGEPAEVLTPAGGGGGAASAGRLTAPPGAGDGAPEAGSPSDSGAADAGRDGAGREASDGSAAVAADTVSLEVVPSPGHAEVYVDGVLAGTGTRQVTLPRSADAPVTVLVKARGYAPRQREILPDGNRSIEVPLRRLSRGESSGDAPAEPEDLRPSPYPEKNTGDLRPSPYSR